LVPQVPKVKPVNLAEVMKNKDKIDLGGGSGIKFGGAGRSIQDTVNSKQAGSGNQGAKPLEIKPKVQVNIEEKLEDLKKRKGNKLT
jgi:hypothetical protein